jgi:hypothetical protein
MGWGRTLLLGDIGNRLDIEDVERDLRNIRRDFESKFRADMSQDDAIRTLIEENGQLKLYLASLIRLLTQKGTISKEELERLVVVIDSEDGTADGKFTGNVT